MTIINIPVSQIHVLNPRARNKVKFHEITTNIAKVGLKKPITVARREGEDGAYDLVCGQGRLEAMIALGSEEIPARVVVASKQDRYLMSLIENLARRRQVPMDLVREVQQQRARGLSHAAIGAKVGISGPYVAMLLRLADNGEERLLRAVDRGEIPLAVAADIAVSDDATVQKCLADAYTSKQLRGKALIVARRLVELRRSAGKAGRSAAGRRGKSKLTTVELVSAYKKQAQRQKLLVKKARVCETRLVFIAGALRRLFDDEHFVTLLRAEALDAVPEYVADAIRRVGA